MSGSDDDWLDEHTLAIDAHMAPKPETPVAGLDASDLVKRLRRTSRERAGVSTGLGLLSLKADPGMASEADTIGAGFPLDDSFIDQTEMDPPNSSPNDIQTSNLLGERYEDLGLLGTGGMGMVRRIKDRLLNRTLAMKILHTKLLDQEISVERFIQEAQVCAQLQHPNVLPIHDLGVLKGGNLYITMTEIRGDSFDTYIKRAHAAAESGSWNEGNDDWNLFRLVGVFHDVCKAIAHAHARHVVHRDLKPQNIMVCDRGEVLVVDWGLAKVLSDDNIVEPIVTERSHTAEHAPANATVAGGIYGTPAYLAPELVSPDAAGATFQSDIYSLGIILYEILRGKQAYQGNNAYDILIKVATTPPESFVTGRTDALRYLTVDAQDLTYVSSRGAPLPPVLVEICLKAIARDPRDRFKSANELVELVGQWLDGSRRREEALQLVSRGHALDALIEANESKASTLSSDAERQSKSIASWLPDSEKRAVWALEDEARQLRADAVVARVQQAQLFRSALAYKDDLTEAHSALASHYRDAHQLAEDSNDMEEMQRAEIVLREHVQALPSSHELKQRCLKYLDGKGILSVYTAPSNATLTLITLSNRNRRLVEGESCSLGQSPLKNHPIEMGTYLLRASLEGYHDVTYPVFNRRLDVTDGVDPSGRQVPLQLLPEGTLGPDDCYVPAGWCWVGGDVRTPNSGARLQVWIDGFVIRRFPVTHREYVSFLNDLVADGKDDEALLHVPREQSSTDEERGAMAYQRLENGAFTLPDDPHRAICWPDQPVTMIQWRSARAFASWLARTTQRPWRLPMEFEWEKAARGVDGRYYPWGDDFDPSWACMKDSHDGDVQMQTIHSFPDDVSVYGVRGTAGNTRDWCLDRFREEGPPTSNGRLLMPSQDDLNDIGFKSSRGGSYGNSSSRSRSADRDWWFPERSYIGRGFRVAWGLMDAADATLEVKNIWS